MARKKASRLQLRKEAEAAEAIKKAAKKKKKATGSSTAKAKKKTATTKKKKATRRVKVKVPQRKRLVWGVFSASMKEEGRFPYDKRKDAEKKIEKLRARSKKPYFIQPIKEPLPDPVPEE